MEKHAENTKKTNSELDELNSVDEMWIHFVQGLKESTNQSVPTKTVQTHTTNKAIWFNKERGKLVKRRGNYANWKQNGDVYSEQQYRDQRRNAKVFFEKRK